MAVHSRSGFKEIVCYGSCDGEDGRTEQCLTSYNGLFDFSFKFQEFRCFNGLFYRIFFFFPDLLHVMPTEYQLLLKTRGNQWKMYSMKYTYFPDILLAVFLPYGSLFSFTADWNPMLQANPTTDIRSKNYLYFHSRSCGL